MALIQKLEGSLIYFFYWLLLSQYIVINKHHLWLRAAIIAGILETFIYQSIETIPFMITITIIPFISQSLVCEEIDNKYSMNNAFI